MSMTKLTLSAERETIAHAKRLAAESGTSVSAMFGRMIDAMLRARGEGAQVGPLTERATGIVALPADKSDRELLQDALDDRHGA